MNMNTILQMALRKVMKIGLRKGVAFLGKGKSAGQRPTQAANRQINQARQGMNILRRFMR
jgi:hypothetical protein